MNKELISDLISVVIILFTTFILLKIVKGFSKKALEKANNIHFRSIQSIFKVAIITISIYSCLSVFDLTKDVSKTVLQSGTLIIAIATFAAQQALGNVISGFSIAFAKPFEVGQKVKVVNGGNIIAEGIISNITIRHTMIKQFDGQICIVPNSTMDSSVIINTNYNGDIGNFFEIEIGYGSDVSRAKEILLNVYKNEELAIKKEEATVFVSQLTSNGLLLKLTVWTKTISDNFLTCSNMRQKVVECFRCEGIEIPYNTITLSENDKQIAKKEVVSSSLKVRPKKNKKN